MPEEIQATEQTEKTEPAASTSVFEGYRDEPLPFGAYLGLVALFFTLLGAILVPARRRGALPERTTWSDLILLGIATHKLARLLQAERSPPACCARRSHTTKGQDDVPGEVCDVARGEGVQRAIGELLTCPLCLGAWLAALFTGGQLLGTRATRAAGGLFTMLAISDFLHLCYTALSDKAK